MTNITSTSPTPRRIGLELEFAGLDEVTVAKTVVGVTGGHAREASAKGWQCETGQFGTCEVYLDSKFSDTVTRLGGQAATDLMRQIVPVELVTAPFALDDLAHFDRVIHALRQEGALGSRDGIVFGFGVHLNIELTDPDPKIIARHVAAYALLEDWLRVRYPIDLARRALPFVNPYPDSLTDAFAADLPDTVTKLIATYTAHVSSRDHGLDLLPVLAMLDEDALRATVADLSAVTARPAYHFRLPDCRIDEADWSILEAWRMWRAVERLATDPNRLDQMRAARCRWSKASRLTRPAWITVVSELMPEYRTEASI